MSTSPITMNTLRKTSNSFAAKSYLENDNEDLSDVMAYPETDHHLVPQDVDAESINDLIRTMSTIDVPPPPYFLAHCQTLNGWHF
jgi:hypothetical protein